MATSRVAYKEKLLLESFQPKPSDLLIGEEINCGAYGVVHKGVFEDCPVAVKKIHKLLFDAASTREAIRRIITEFKKEADMLIVIQHPHVVRSFGAFYDPQKREPILVMELMAMNLREFIANSKGSPELQESAQIRIIFQIALGIQYLHHLSPPLAHRDLNDKNVLLAEDGTAKIGDLGQAKYKSTRDSYYDSKAPGSVLFMPPETFNDNPHYTESVDIFSLGVLVVEVATHSFPSVGMMGIGTTPEVERRAKDLKKMKADHPLKPLVLNCLRNNYKSRPDIDHVICGIIRIFTRQLSVKDKEIEDLRSAVETKDLELVLKNDIEEQVSDKDRDIAHLTSIVEMKDRQKAELECDISAKNREIENLRKTVELKDAELQQKEGVEKLLHDKNREINVLQSVIERKDDELRLVKNEFEKEYENPRGQVMAMEREWNQQKKELEEERAKHVEEIEDLKRQIVSKECEQQQEKDKLEEQCQVLQARLVESDTSFELRSTRLTESLKENAKHLRQAFHTVAVLLDGNQRSTMVAADFMKSHTSLLKGLGMGFHNYIRVENGTQRSNGLKPLDTKADSEIHMSLPTKSEQIQSRLHEDVPSMIHTHLRGNVFPNGVVKETMLTKPALNAQKIEEQPSVTGQTYDSAQSSESGKPVADVQPADIHVEERLHDTRLNKSGVKSPGCKDADRTIDETEHVSFPRHSEKENTKVMGNCGSRDTKVPIEKHLPESSDQQPQDISTCGSTAIQDTHVPPFITKEHPLHSTTVKEANSPTTRGVDPVEIDRGDLEAFSAVCKEEKVSELKSKKALEEAKAGIVVHTNHSGHLDKQPHTKTKGSTTDHKVLSDVDNQPLANLPGFRDVDSQVHVKGMKATNLQRGEPEQGLKRTSIFIEDNKGPNTDPADVPEVQSASTHVKSQPLSTGTGNESMLQAQSGSLNAKIEVTNRKIAAMKVEEEGLKPKTVSEDAQKDQIPPPTYVSGCRQPVVLTQASSHVMKTGIVAEKSVCKQRSETLPRNIKELGGADEELQRKLSKWREDAEKRGIVRTSNAHTFHDQTTKEHVQEPSTVTRNKSGSPPLDAQRVDPHSQPSTPPTQSKSDQEETEALSGTNENDHKKAVPPSSVSTDDPVNHLTQSATHVKMNDDAPVTRKRSNTLKHTKEPKSLQSCQAGISNELLGKLRKWKQQADTNVYVSNDTNSEVPDNI